MSCLCPISIPDKVLARLGYKGHELIVPCGHCTECARDKRNDWFVRLWSAYKRCESLGIKTWFVTVTIDPRLWPNMTKSSPGIGDRISPFMRSWCERLRYLNGGTVPLRFLCSEFGSEGREYVDSQGIQRVTTGALHFHGLLFGNLNVRALQVGFAKTHGHVDFSLIKGPQCIRYTVKYATKDFSIEDYRLRARVFCSPGIGDPTFYFGNSPATSFVLINGYHYRTPRYFVDKQWSILYGRSALFDEFGHNIFVKQRALSRISDLNHLYDLALAEKSFDPGLRDYLYAKRENELKRPADIDLVLTLIDLKLTGPSHPLYRYYEKRVCELNVREYFESDETFISVKPYQNLIYHERHQTFIPLSFDFQT